MSGDSSMSSLHDWFAAAGWDTYGADLTNRGCSEQVAQRLAARLTRIAERSGPVTLIGHSRGGQMAVVLAARQPQFVDRTITLASPLIDPFAMHLMVRLLACGCAGLSRLGVPDLVRDCPLGGCCQQFFDDMRRTPTRALTCIYSRRDGIIDWHSALRQDADLLEVTATHRGIVDSEQTRLALAHTLQS
jgi:triacylglycerol lipase